MGRWKYIGFLLGCVSLLLVGCGAAQEEALPQLAKPVWEEPGQEENTEKTDEELPAEPANGESTEVVSIEEEEKGWTLDSPYAQAYYDFLEEFISGKTAAELEETGFYLALIDDDRIPELLLFHGDSENSKVELYTCYDGQVTELGEFGIDGEMMYCERSGIVIHTFWGARGEHTYFYEIENGGYREIAYLHCGWYYSDGDDGEEYTTFFYEVDGVTVSREAYYVRWNELSNHQENIWVRFENRYPLGEKELLSTLSQALEKVLQPLAIEDMLWKRDSEPVLEQLAQQSEILEAYGDFLTENADEGDAFALIYRDNEDVPELVVIEAIEHLDDAGVYRYEQGQVIYTGMYGQFGEAACLEKQKIPVEGTDIREALAEKMQTLILTRYDTLKRNLLIKSGLGEEDILLMDYDDYDSDGIYEAFAFCGEEHQWALGEITYEGDFWFVSADRCMKLPVDVEYGRFYRKIDGQMVLGTQGHKQKYLYYYSDYCLTANISEIWTVEDGNPVAVILPQSGQVLYRGDSQGFELWADGYNHYYEPADDLWTGHTWRPYFYHYDGESVQLRPDEREELSRGELAELCGFDLVAEVEAEGCEVTEIVRWQPSDIVTVNYLIPLDEEAALPEITYENIIWDCKARDYWRSEERGVSSWRNAGVGGSI